MEISHCGNRGPRSGSEKKTDYTRIKRPLTIQSSKRERLIEEATFDIKSGLLPEGSPPTRQELTKGGTLRDFVPDI